MRLWFICWDVNTSFGNNWTSLKNNLKVEFVIITYVITTAITDE